MTGGVGHDADRNRESDAGADHRRQDPHLAPRVRLLNH
jgi:hypothetical protein